MLFYCSVIISKEAFFYYNPIKKVLKKTKAALLPYFTPPQRIKNSVFCGIFVSSINEIHE
jgi:hypothetical protein